MVFPAVPISRSRLPEKRSPKVIENALIAGFHRIIHRARPRPVWSSERVTKYKHLNAGVVGEVSPGLDRPPEPSFQALDAAATRQHRAYLDVVVVRNGMKVSHALVHNRMIAG
jgi:hypothetical protein